MPLLPFGVAPANITKLLPSQASKGGDVLSTDGLGGLSWISAGGTGDMNKATYDAANVGQQLLGLSATQSPTNKTFDNTNQVTLKDTKFTLQDDGDTSKQLAFQLSSIATATTQTLTAPNASGTIALTANDLSVFAATTSLQLKGVISDETGSGALVFANTPTLVTPVLGVASATSLNKLTITAPATGSTLTIDDGFTLHVTGNVTAFSGSSTGANTGDQTITLTGAVTGSGTGSFATTIATPGTLTVSSSNSTATAHTHAITSSSAPGAAASLLATDSSGIIGSTGTRIVKGWFTDLTVTNNIAGSITGNAATVTTNANLTGDVTSVGNATTLAAGSASNLNSGTLPAGRMPALTGDITTSAGAVATTIKTSVTLAGSPVTTTQSPSDNSTKIATTAYVDNAVLGQNFKEAVGAATTANLVGVYLNGASGVGATFTYTATGVDTIDGVTLTLGMRVLLKNQTSTFQNGIYTVTTAGAIGVAGILTRAADADQSGEWKTGDSTFVTAGTTLSTTTWAYTGVDSPTMGTDAITFAQTAGQGSFSGGNGITITGTSIAIDTSITVDKTTAQVLTNKDLTSGTNTFPTFNQNTTGSAAKWTTARLLAGNSVDGSAAVAFANKFIVQGTTDSGLSAAQFMGALGTGIVKNTTTTGVLSIAVAGDFPTLNQNTSGTAAGLSATLVPASGGTGVANNNSSTLTISGNFGTTLTVSATTSVTLPTSGTLYGTASSSITSSQLATSLSDETGTGVAVFGTSPTLTTSANINGAAGTARSLYFTSGGVNRAEIQLTNVSEAGSNAGSNLAFNNYNDAGTYVNTTMQITRSSGFLNIYQGASIAGGLNVPSQTNNSADALTTDAAQTVTNKILSDAFMGNAFTSQSATARSVTLSASTNFVYSGLLKIGSGFILTIPSTSSLQINPLDNGATSTASGIVRLTNQLGGTANQPVVTAPVHENMILNGGMDIWQRGTTFTNFTTDTYGPDRWNLLSSTTAQWTVAQSTNAPPGFKSSAKCSQTTSTNGQVALVQFLENIDSMKFNNQVVSLSFWAQSTAGKEISNLRATILSWTSTADAVTSAVVSSWAGNGTDPTWATNWTANKPGSNLALGQQWQRFTVEGIVLNTASMANLALVIWSDDTTVTNLDEFYITGIQINVGASAAAFQPRAYAQELQMCQRYCWSFSTAAGGIIGWGWSKQTTNATIMPATHTVMRASPTLTATASDWQIADSVNAAIDVTAIAIDADPLANGNIPYIQATVASGATQFRPYALRGDSGGTRVLILDAEL